MNAQTEIEEAYRIAKEADDAFEAACRAAGFTSRWEDGVSTHPMVKPARDAKVAADEAWHTAFLAAERAALANASPTETEKHNG